MKRLVPTPGELIDAAVVAALGVLALLGFARTFEGSAYLVVGGVAIVIGVLLAHVTNALRQPGVVLAALTLVVYFVAGPPLVLPDDPWWSFETFRALAAAAALAWKQLLTTVPPVEEHSPLLVIPYLLGLLTGAVGFGMAQRLARRSRPGSVVALARAGAPALAPLGALAVVLACGTNQPGAKVLDGVVVAIICLMWTSTRLRRLRPPARSTTRPVRRAVSGAGVLAAAGVLAVFAAGYLPGAQTPRTVLRDYIVPPFDLSNYPSPLVGFRKYTKDANKLYDQQLFTITGLPAGTAVRIATLDDYDGTVWGATDEDAFRLVSSRITTESAGPLTTVEVTIGAAYAASLDVNAWLPEAGVVSRIDFAGERARELGASLHYSRDLSAGIVTARLRDGDTYTMQTALVDTELPDQVLAYGSPTLTENAQAMLSSKIAAWTPEAPDLGSRLKAVAEYLQNNGAYTNGGPGETQYLPGHGVGRLTAFLQEQTPAGDDEQYAALFALAANYLGLPARVVFGARPDATGVVYGKDVHAWVEVRLADGRWATVPETAFMPDVSKKPNVEPPQTFESNETPIVPPPNAGRLPTTPTDTSRVDPFPQQPQPGNLWQTILAIAIVVASWLGPPLLIVLLIVGTIRTIKRRRRRGRRKRGLPATRFAGAWQELVDGVRDLAQVKPELRSDAITFGATRQEHAVVLDRAGVLPPGTFLALAIRVDEIVYGADEPSAKDARAFWTELDTVRAQLTAGLGRTQRWRVALSLRSLRTADPTRTPSRPAAPPRPAPTPFALAGGRTA